MSGLLSLISKSTLLWNVWDEIVDGVSNFVGSLLWVFCDIFFVILDLFENLFRMFAGISSSVKTSSGSIIEGDLVLYFINSDIVQEMFFSIIVLSFILLLIFTIFAIVKNQYAEKQEPVTKIINSSFKALLMYLLVPVATVVCLIVGNVVLQAIDGATKLNSSGGASDMLFAAATYNANRLRSGSDEDRANQLDGIIKSGYLSQQTKDELSKAAGVSSVEDIVYATEVDWDDLAQIIDEAFIQEGIDTPDGGVNQKADKWNFAFVNNYYYGLKISFITIWVGGAFLIWAIGKMAWGMVARLFKMVLFFALSPAVMATFPIQGDKALGAWRSEMVKNGTSAYCAVGVLNVLYSILPFFNGIKLGIYGGLGTAIAKLFIYIIAFSSAQNLISTVSGWFGTGNALADGIAAKGQVTAAQKKMGDFAKKGVGMYQGMKGGISAAKDHGGNAFAGAIQGLYGQTKFAKDMATNREEWKKAKGAGEAQYKTARTYGFMRAEADKDKLAEYEAEEAVISQLKAIDTAEKKLDTAFKLEAERKGFKEGSDEYNALKARYDKEKSAIRTSAAFVGQIYEGQDKVQESMAKQAERDAANFASFDNYAKSQETMSEYKKIFSQFFKNGTVSDTQMEKIAKGDFSHLSNHMAGDNKTQKEENYKRLKEAYSIHAGGMFETQRNIDMAQQGIANLANLGGDSQKFIQHFKNELEVTIETKDLGGGKTEEVITSVNGVKDVQKFLDKIEQVRTDIINKNTAEVAELKAEIKKGKEDVVARARDKKLTDEEKKNIKKD